MIPGEQGTENLRRLWREALDAETPGVSAEAVLGRLERKYRDLADHHEAAGGARE